MSITVDIPPIPLTEVLLALLIYLVWRCLEQMTEGNKLLRELRELQAGGSPNGTMVARRGTPSASSNDPSKQPVTRPLRQPAAPIVVERFLADSAQLFAECLLDEGDVDVNRFLRACRFFATVLEKAGPFTMLSIRETQSNIQKIEGTFLLDPERFRSMHSLLQEEVSSGMHAPGGLLADPSAAIGLLWARRGLQFWVSFFRPHNTRAETLESSEEIPFAISGRASDARASDADEANAIASSLMPAAVSPQRSPPARLATSTGWSPPSDERGSLSENVSGMMSDTVGGLKEVFKEKLSGVLSPTGYAEALRAYRESIEPFNGWIARNTFTLTARATPDWQSFSKKLGPPGTIIEDVSLWSTAVSALLLRMKQMHEELDLVDVRKTI